jgi:two-component system, cell cycle sensor histidine kinase and response regulator CckA
MKILIVDDLLENLDLLDDIFTTYNYLTIRAKNGIEGIEILKREKVNLIVSDILMPSMDGFEFCQEVKKNNEIKDIPFIFYTAHYYDPEDKEYALKLGADRYFVKPVDINVLMNTVNELTKSADIKPNDLKGEKTPPDEENISIQEYHQLRDKMFELGVANERLMQKNKELISSHGRYRSLFESAGDAIFIIEPRTGTILDTNQQAEKSTGLLKNELLGMKIFDFDNHTAIAEGKIMTETFESYFQKQNGEIKIFEITANLINDTNTFFIQAIARDVTEQRKLKEKLIQTDKLVSLGQLSAGISHEIRNPLASINLNLQLLSRMINKDIPEYEILVSAQQGVERIKKIIDTTLDYVRLNKSTDLNENLNNIIMNTMPLIQVSMVKKDIEIKLELSENIPEIKADSKQIQQVLINLLTNASEAIQEKGEITIITREDANNIKLIISDTGEGISQDNLSHIFEPFYTRKSGGTGLGLSVVKEILEQHGSTINVKSQINKGTAFTIYFPKVR